MGEVPGQSDRMAVRPPMQWRPDRKGGFSTAPRSRARAAVAESGYGPERVNVHDQQRDPDSLLTFIKMLISRYREAPEIAWGSLTVLDAGDRSVLAHTLSAEGAAFLALHNFSDEPRRVELSAAETGGEMLRDLLDAESPVSAERGRFVLDLDAYGFRWYRVATPDPLGP